MHEKTQTQKQNLQKSVFRIMSHAAMSILQKICNNIIHPSMFIMPPGIQGAMIIFS